MGGAACKAARCWPHAHRILDQKVLELSNDTFILIANNHLTEEQIFRLVDGGEALIDILDAEAEVRKESRRRQREYETTVWQPLIEDILKEAEQ